MKTPKKADLPLSLQTSADVPAVLAALLRRVGGGGTPSKAHVQAIYSNSCDYVLLMISFDGGSPSIVIQPAYQDAAVTAQLLDAIDEALCQLNNDTRPDPAMKLPSLRILAPAHRVIDRNVKGADGRDMPPMLMSYLREGAYRLGMQPGDDGPNPNPGIFIASGPDVPRGDDPVSAARREEIDAAWQAQSIAVHEAQKLDVPYSAPIPQCYRRITVKPLDPTEALAVHEKLKERHAIKSDEYQPMREATRDEIERLGPIGQPFMTNKATKLEAGEDA